ncbi:MAG: hypothetical protein A3B70_08230 [Deltaproteobacteria bacterium RIFCSPHIGHO2_02_FULL_40_11]|nr:MAG: hypothetical protein A3B70_08230 [Deltaproteobacteria bacterium RIFCSPHIGHO2_02_FULL_40_11]
MLQITPLGGLGQIGMNMMVIETAQDALIIDCGVMFPESKNLGVDLIIPDFSYLQKIKHKVRALLLTHGHEDHIGAVPFLLNHLQTKIYGSRFTLALLKHKLTEHGKSKTKLHVVQPHELIQAGCFKIEFLQVTHSIVDGMGIAIQTPMGTMIHTADFKLDDHPYHGRSITLQKFKEYGKKGVLLLMSDSTNVEREGKALSETKIAHEIEKICKTAKKKIIFSVFATNIRRIEQMFEIALRLNRKVVLSGRSLETNVPIAIQEGFISKKAASVLMDLDDLDALEPKKTMIICTGSQAEERSALARIAIREHRLIQVEKEDCVILSSRFIPGNEKAISDLLNNLCRQGADVYYDKVADVHVSGHAHASELRRMIGAVKPKYFLPVHGEYRHLVRHSKLAQGMKIKKENVFVCENGEPLIFHDVNRVQKGQKMNLERVFVENEGLDDLKLDVIRNRKKLSFSGIVFVCLVRDKKTKKLLSPPYIWTMGVFDEVQHAAFLKKAHHYIFQVADQYAGPSTDFSEEVRLQTRRFFKRKTGKKPIVKPIVIDI